MDVTDGNRIPMGYEQITDLSSAVGLTVPSSASIIAGRMVTARLALMRAEGAPIRWRGDGVAPTASVGMHLEAADGFFPYTGDLGAFLAILESGSPKLNIEYYY
ncbi:MAG: hypothetical protein IT531_00140 [Burkholderiales bacterium]|nr:hypothetical protein [Burkholderiales bacterium]